MNATDSTGAERNKTSSNLVISDDDTQPPTITVTGSSGTEITSQTQEFTWGIFDASGTNSVVVVTQNGSEIFRQYESDDPARITILQSIIADTIQQRDAKIADEAVVQSHLQALSNAMQSLLDQIASLQQIQPPPLGACPRIRKPAIPWFFSGSFCF